MVEIAIPFNRRTVQFAQRRQHLVNHGSQRDVNHSRQTPHRYFRLTQNIKRIPTRFCHDFRVTRHKSRARESFKASMRSGEYAGSGRALRLDPSGLPVRFFAGDAASDGQVRPVELHGERVVMRRALRGTRMALNMPVAAFDAARIFHHSERATRPAARRASAPPPSPTERFEDQEALNPSQTRNPQNYKRDADSITANGKLSRETRFQD